MTDEEAFKQLAVEALGGFGWSVTVDDLPDYDSAFEVLRRLNEWWLGLDQFTRDLITGFDLADGLWNSGWMNEWPGLYQLISGNPFGRFSDTMNDIVACLQSAHNRAPDYAAEHAVTPMADDPEYQAGQGNSAPPVGIDGLLPLQPRRRPTGAGKPAEV